MLGLKQAILAFHSSVYEWVFISTSLMIFALGIWMIPKATDMATNSAAGLAGKYFGPKQRTLVINATTNLPELFLMLVSLLGLRRLGGIATPLGSNFANIYLMFLAAPLFLIVKWLIQGKSLKVQRFLKLISQERKLVCWHVVMSLLMFAFATLTYKVVTGSFRFVDYTNVDGASSPLWYILGCAICLIGVSVFLTYEAKLKAQRPFLYDDISADEFEESPLHFLMGAILLCLLCYVFNSFFAGWTTIYEDRLASDAMFFLLHYFIGSLISSLPEITVAIENYERLDSPDLNTALASASQSNMSNLAIASLGSGIAVIMILLGGAKPI